MYKYTQRNQLINPIHIEVISWYPDDHEVTERFYDINDWTEGYECNIIVEDKRHNKYYYKIVVRETPTGSMIGVPVITKYRKNAYTGNTLVVNFLNKELEYFDKLNFELSIAQKSESGQEISDWV